MISSIVDLIKVKGIYVIPGIYKKNKVVIKLLIIDSLFVVD